MFGFLKKTPPAHSTKDTKEVVPQKKKDDYSYAEGSDAGVAAFAAIFTMKDREIVKWQRVAFCAIGCVVVSVLCVTYIGTKSTFIPYAIQVDEETGYVNSLGAIDQKTVKLTDPMIHYFLSRFVEGMRSIPMDKNALQQNVNRAVKLLTPSAANKYKTLYLDSFTGLIGSSYNRVEVLSVLPVSGQKNVYTVRWKEIRSSLAGQGSDSEFYYTGTFSIKQEPITDKEALAVNPLGLFITDFSFSEEAEGRKK